MIVYTSICANYLHKARTLAKSVKDNIPNTKFIVCMTERVVPLQARCCYFDEVVLAKDMWPGDFDRFIFKHAIVEASTAVKGEFLKYLMERFSDEEAFIYLDPDCYVYSDFPELKEKLKTRPVVLCPHLLQPGNIDMELSSTAHGVYNLGFLAVNHSEEAQRFVAWWAQRLSMYCYDDIPHGIFTDQKWIDLAPCFFDVEVFKHHGYDFATWSLMDSELSEDNGNYFVKGDPLRFIHYSGYGKTIEKCMREWMPEGEREFHTLYAAYSKLHEKNDEDHVSTIPWTYSNYSSGKKISDRVRGEYRDALHQIGAKENPFELSNRKIHSIYGHAKRNPLVKAFELMHQGRWKELLSRIYKRLNN